MLVNDAILYQKLSRISLLFVQKCWIRDTGELFTFLFCKVWRIRFSTNTPSESTIAPKSNLIRLGSAHEWSGVRIGPQEHWRDFTVHWLYVHASKPCNFTSQF